MHVKLRVCLYLSLQSIFNLKYDHSILVHILELYTELTWDGRDSDFTWVPGHVSIGGNSAADSAAKDALVGIISGSPAMLALETLLLTMPSLATSRLSSTLSQT